MNLLTWCRVVSQARVLDGAGLGLKFAKIFPACIQNFFIALGVRIFLFLDVDLL